MRHLDGSTTEPLTFSGDIGKSLQKCVQLPLVKFESIKCKLPVIHRENRDIRIDQKYLWDMCQAISKGHCSLSLCNSEPGLLSHAIWLTTAYRILSVYVGTEGLSDNLKTLVEFILKVYACLWLQIKTQPTCNYGARHTWKSFSLTRYLGDNLKTVVEPVIQRNAYLTHPENMLLSMITDERGHIWELGL